MINRRMLYVTHTSHLIQHTQCFLFPTQHQCEAFQHVGENSSLVLLIATQPPHVFGQTRHSALLSSYPLHSMYGLGEVEKHFLDLSWH